VAAAQVLTSSPFNVFGILCMAWVLYGMAGMQPGWQHVLKAGTVSALIYLIALQVRGGQRVVCHRAVAAVLPQAAYVTMSRLHTALNQAGSAMLATTLLSLEASIVVAGRRARCSLLIAAILELHMP
jgi:hypothetical protein